MRRLLRVLIVTGFVLAALLLTLTGTVVYVVRHSFPTYDGEADLPGLSADVEVIRDAAGIPQIYADTTADLFAAQGYVHAQDRFFEMDFRRHVTAGPAGGAVRRGRAGDGQVRPYPRLAPGRGEGARRAQRRRPGRYLDDYARGRERVPGRPPGHRPVSLEYAVLS